MARHEKNMQNNLLLLISAIPSHRSGACLMLDTTVACVSMSERERERVRESAGGARQKCSHAVKDMFVCTHIPSLNFIRDK